MYSTASCVNHLGDKCIWMHMYIREVSNNDLILYQLWNTFKKYDSLAELSGEDFWKGCLNMNCANFRSLWNIALVNRDSWEKIFDLT